MVTVPQVAMSDRFCVRCGYSLRGMQPHGNCPECGLGIVRSLALGQQLQQSRPTWIASLAWAARLLLAAEALLLLVPLAEPLWGYLFEVKGWSWWFGIGVFRAEVVRTSVIFLSALANLIGSWLLTRRENPYAAAEPLRRRYVMLRVCSTGTLVASLLWLFVAVSYLLWPYTPWLWQLGRPIERCGNWLMWLYALCPIMQLGLLRRLSARVLNRRLIEHTNIAGIGFPAGVILLFVAFLVSSNWGWSFAILHSIVGYVMTLLVWVFIGLFWLWSMYAFGLSARAFARAAHEARAEWKKADASLPTR